MRAELPFEWSGWRFFKTGHLRLRDADLARDLHLRAACLEAQGQNALFTLRQMGDGLAQRDGFNPLLVGIFRSRTWSMTVSASPPSE